MGSGSQDLNAVEITLNFILVRADPCVFIVRFLYERHFRMYQPRAPESTITQP